MQIILVCHRKTNSTYTHTTHTTHTHESFTVLCLCQTPLEIRKKIKRLVAIVMLELIPLQSRLFWIKQLFKNVRINRAVTKSEREKNG